MEEGSKSKKTVFVGGVGEEVDEATIYEHFSTFGDIIEVQLPSCRDLTPHCRPVEAKHRGFAFVTYGSAADAQDAIDNMDLNELQGRVIKVNFGTPHEGSHAAARGKQSYEEWLKANALPLSQSGGVRGGRVAKSEDAIEEETAQEDAMEE
ncbi:RNA-binding domain-containing protein [Mycena vulgaris]|nr:RNA-binding domain-containing protein [Mycena vulgaris]